MCLAIPGRVVEMPGPEQRLAVVEVSKVRRRVNVDLLSDEPLAAGDWFTFTFMWLVLSHELLG